MTSSAAGKDNGPFWAPWHVLLHWTPFKIDALGLVTLLGTEEVNAAVGRLVSSAYLEYLPLLGAYVIAGDRFTEKVAGWNLYNISQGIHTTDLAAWLTRWMLSQEFETTRSYVVWKVTPPRSRKNDLFASVLIGFVLNGFLVAGTVASADWYGLANALAMVVSVLVRVYVIGQQRIAVDAMVDKAVTSIEPPRKDTYEDRRHKYKDWKRDQKEQKQQDVRRGNFAAMLSKENPSSHSVSSATANGQKEPAQQVQTMARPTRPNPNKYATEEWTGKKIKVLIIQSDSKAVTFQMPNELVMPRSLFIEGPTILNPKTYFIARSIGWIAFAVHIVAIGMADLATQLYTVVLIVLPTLLLVKKTGCDDSEWMTTFRSWSQSLYHSRTKRGTPRKTLSVDERAKLSELKFVRHCWIGTRLKAEIYEWPESYEFHQEGDDKHWVSGSTTPPQERSKKRQDLYAWLALTRDEEESMDKWDLFPHIRNDNFSWWHSYKQKKHALIGKSVPNLPQHIKEPETKKTGTQNSRDQNPKPFLKSGRTGTWNFVQGSVPGRTGAGEPRQSSSGAGGSSAFPAITSHEQEVAAEDSQVGDVVQSADAADRADSAGLHYAPAGLPRVDTQGSTRSGQIDPLTAITQSPTVINATDEQP